MSHHCWQELVCMQSIVWETGRAKLTKSYMGVSEIVNLPYKLSAVCVCLSSVFYTVFASLTHSVFEHTVGFGTCARVCWYRKKPLRVSLWFLPSHCACLNHSIGHLLQIVPDSTSPLSGWRTAVPQPPPHPRNTHTSTHTDTNTNTHCTDDQAWSCLVPRW